MSEKAVTNLKKLRKAKGLSQGQTAELFGVTQSLISHIENGRSDITVNQAIRYAGLLNVSLVEFLPPTQCAEALIDE